ncbi:Lipoate synthase [Chitinispirillum alkaliphilum]|nr:Lipoate synthase [Chitinispirillum alkaliphilum]
MTEKNSPNNPSSSTKPRRFPQWLKRPVAFSGKQGRVEQMLQRGSLNTVCSEAKCPNRSECYNQGTATFLIMGTVCTRNCSFCAVTHGTPARIEPDEGKRIATAAAEMELQHVVITSVTRDDLQDGGASCFADVVKRIRELLPDVSVEILVPDFRGDEKALRTVLSGRPHVFNHNLETVPRLYSKVRPQAGYALSLELLRKAGKWGEGVVTKSGIMVGLGESESEVETVMHDLFSAGCSILTIGQYLQPSTLQLKVEEFVTPEQFAKYGKIAREIGFAEVFSAPYVRSSYRAFQSAAGVLTS